MSFFKEMDLYKAIILLSALLLPAGAWYISGLDEQITRCEAARRAATKRGGYLEEIGKLQKQIEVVAQNRRAVSIENPSTYFETQIRAANPALRAADFSPKQPKGSPRTVGRQKVIDQVVAIDWGRGESRREVKLDFVYAVLFNCESGARANGAAGGPPSVWKLRSLRLDNATNKNAGRGKTPPPEFEDRWTIQKMEFARREPRAK